MDGTVDLAYANNAGWVTTNPLGGNNPYQFIPGNDYLNDMVTRTLAEPESPGWGSPRTFTRYGTRPRSAAPQRFTPGREISVTPERRSCPRDPAIQDRHPDP